MCLYCRLGTIPRQKYKTGAWNLSTCWKTLTTCPAKTTLVMNAIKVWITPSIPTSPVTRGCIQKLSILIIPMLPPVVHQMVQQLVQRECQVMTLLIRSPNMLHLPIWRLPLLLLQIWTPIPKRLNPRAIDHSAATLSCENISAYVSASPGSRNNDSSAPSGVNEFGYCPNV